MTAERLEEANRSQVAMPIIDLSSSELRRRVADGQSIRFRTPRAVEKFIETQGLYRGPSPRLGLYSVHPHSCSVTAGSK